MIKTITFNKEYAMTFLCDLKKQGYADSKAMPTWLRNEFRELSLEDAVKTVNNWIDEYKIKDEEHIRIITTKDKYFVVTQSEYDRYASLLNDIKKEVIK